MQVMLAVSGLNFDGSVRPAGYPLFGCDECCVRRCLVHDGVDLRAVDWQQVAAARAVEVRVAQAPAAAHHRLVGDGPRETRRGPKLFRSGLIVERSRWSRSWR